MLRRPLYKDTQTFLYHYQSLQLNKMCIKISKQFAYYPHGGHEDENSFCKY
jgi:hypothetical protein